VDADSHQWRTWITCDSLYSCYSDTDIDTTENGNNKKKILIGVALAAIVGIACACGVIFGGGKRKSSMDQAIKSTGLNVTASGKLKLFDSQSKFNSLSTS
jgi:ABC-type uncharacterized transport system permease subunit